MQLVAEFEILSLPEKNQAKLYLPSDFSVFSVVEAIQLQTNWVSEWP